MKNRECMYTNYEQKDVININDLEKDYLMMTGEELFEDNELDVIVDLKLKYIQIMSHLHSFIVNSNIEAEGFSFNIVRPNIHILKSLTNILVEIYQINEINKKFEPIIDLLVTLIKEDNYEELSEYDLTELEHSLTSILKFEYNKVNELKDLLYEDYRVVKGIKNISKTILEINQGYQSENINNKCLELYDNISNFLDINEELKEKYVEVALKVNEFNILKNDIIYILENRHYIAK